jgi:hypothetical protein
MQLIGADWTSAPSRRRPIWIARGERRGARLTVISFTPAHGWDQVQSGLAGEWLGGFDFPFALPAEVPFDAFGFPTRAEFRSAVKAWIAARPPGSPRYLRRRIDNLSAGQSPLNVVRPPVGLMYYEGVRRFEEWGIRRWPMQDPGRRTAIETYPKLVAQRIASGYKRSDSAALRQRILDGLVEGRLEPIYGVRLCVPNRVSALAVEDPSGDPLDSLLSLVQTAWTVSAPGWGVPEGIDRREGWIVDPGNLAA